ncbi:Hypothetical protein PP7435_CHR2-1263 [Komagataella phaffii CBS 7435]|uniref:Uncharacterized protein n=2 Tax=Komagataella phaffii TaxID=460519 RepID=C4QZH1_KOMPG|nr:Hypothetical protein PAS_chr2-1_0045 [Komagataella phaffii GS115]AOA62812.1 GQ67_00070T0 [Komagataella phaffii]CAH2448860.1 Hypothetical protein BQ9382_C2-6795 [Komagataella phaffii CBS 7435]AOA67796.1 GQ68_01317T0 [Komagataella phaffii GS115]CAY68645.1 Hypothetical protein PAS_chr2-1_0045 [Komagataella phaffii GS115]CCA38938.1 Hypothetical protein PP7435_CHR2-1263 [Komagataella phaffii CBS 7435]
MKRQNQPYELLTLKKQKAEQPESSIEHTHGPVDLQFGQRKAFPVDLDIDPSRLPQNEGSLPQDVMTYLAMVRMEAEGNARYNIDEDENFYLHETVKTKENIALDPVDNEHQVHITWHHDYTEYFKARQEKLSILGKEIEGDEKFIEPSSAQLWKKYVFETTPDDRLIVAIPFDVKFKMIIYFTRWLNKTLNANLIKWIEITLESLPELLEGTEISLLRNLAKKAIKLRGNDLDSTSLSVMDEIISIVGDVYHQRDLLEGYL